MDTTRINQCGSIGVSGSSTDVKSALSELQPPLASTYEPDANTLTFSIGSILVNQGCFDMEVWYV